MCRNEKYGYEFKYPRGWTVHDEEELYDMRGNNVLPVPKILECDRLMIIVSQGGLADSSFAPLSIGVSIRDIDDWDIVANSVKEFGLLKKKEVIFKEFVLHGKTVKYQIAIFSINAGIFYKKDKFIFLTVPNLKGEKLMNAIISTFKFLD